jgi:hypothetical protein
MIFNSLFTCVLLLPLFCTCGIPAADVEMTTEGFQELLAPRPRILVCAPSNAAIDELLERILRWGASVVAEAMVTAS